MISIPRWDGVVASVIGLAMLAGPLEGRQLDLPDRDFQTATYVTVGYATNAPKQLLGFSGMAFSPRLSGWGLYVDAKLALDSPADEPEFDSSLSVELAEQFGDDDMEAKSEWTSINVALVRALTPALAVYAGGGYSREEAYRRYFDGTRERGRLGTYWVEDEEGSGGRLNLLGGLWFRATRSILFQFGMESAPTGVTVGAAYVLPFR